MPENPIQIAVLALVLLGFVALWWTIKDGDR